MGNHHKKDYRFLRAVSLWLHDMTCYMCKKKFETLECHHINKDSTDNRIENFMPACNSCHKMLGRTSIKPEIMHSEIARLLQLKLDKYNGQP